MQSTEKRKKPVTLLTGFLGAGKTTLLNEFLKFRRGVRFAIVENEIGQEGIDGDLVLQSSDTVLEMNNGCICCSLNDNFYDILRDLYIKNSSWDEMIIEATGIADPAGVALPFLANPNISSAYRLERIICLIDPLHIEQQLWETEEAIKQIAFSDILLINKCDLIEADHLQNIKQILSEMNPMAQIMEGSKGHFPLADISAFVREESEEESLTVKAADHVHDDHQHGHDHGDIRALSFDFTESFNLETLSYRLNAFLLFQSKEIYRAKGIFYDSTEPRKVIVQSVGQSLLISPGSAWKPHEERKSRMVFIGKHLKPEGFDQMLRECMHDSEHNTHSYNL